MAKLRIRKSNHAMNRSFGGDLGIYIILAIFGAFMFIPMLYTVIQSLKPLDELWMYPPRFWVQKPTLDNFGDLLKLMGITNMVNRVLVLVFVVVFNYVASKFWVFKKPGGGSETQE